VTDRSVGEPTEGELVRRWGAVEAPRSLTGQQGVTAGAEGFHGSLNLTGVGEWELAAVNPFGQSQPAWQQAK